MAEKEVPKLIVLERDAQSQADVASLASRWYRVLRTADVTRAMAWIADEPGVRVLVSGQELGGDVDGVGVLERARDTRPDVLRVLLTHFSRLDDVVAGIHSGAVQRMAQKPVTANDLLSAVRPA